MKIQLSERSYLEDQTLLIQLTIQLSSFFKLSNSLKFEALQSLSFSC